MVDLLEAPIHTNKAIAIKNINQEKRKSVSKKTLLAIQRGDTQAVIDSLSALQLRFVEEFLVDLDGTKAMMRTGSKSNNPKQRAFQIMENPGVRIAIDALKAERMKNSDVTKDFVLKGIQKAIKMAEESNNINALLRGYELLAKHLGMFVERTEISGPDGEAIKYQKDREDAQDFLTSITKLSKRTS